MQDLDWTEILDNFFKLSVAYGLALPMALERERKSRSAGLRTFPLVAIACCGFLLVGAKTLGADSDEALARLLAALMTGMGFIGGGAILKDGNRVQGTATAAAMWTTGAIGAAVAFERWEVAITMTVVSTATFLLLQPVKERVGHEEGSETSD